eukprot:3611968-Rhodomonas_salina.1
MRRNKQKRGFSPIRHTRIQSRLLVGGVLVGSGSTHTVQTRRYGRAAAGRLSSSCVGCVQRAGGGVEPGGAIQASAVDAGEDGMGCCGCACRAAAAVVPGRA